MTPRQEKLLILGIAYYIFDSEMEWFSPGGYGSDQIRIMQEEYSTRLHQDWLDRAEVIFQEMRSECYSFQKIGEFLAQSMPIGGDPFFEDIGYVSAALFDGKRIRIVSIDKGPVYMAYGVLWSEKEPSYRFGSYHYDVVAELDFDPTSTPMEELKLFLGGYHKPCGPVYQLPGRDIYAINIGGTIYVMEWFSGEDYIEELEEFSEDEVEHGEYEIYIDGQQFLELES